MTPIFWRFALVFFLAFAQLQCQDQGEEQNEMPDMETETSSVLIFSKTAGFRHQSIEKGIATLRALGNENQFDTTHSEDAGIFTQEGLAEFNLVIFLNTTMNILTREQELAFETWMRQGGSFMGIHAATDTEYGWPWYGNLVGAYFNGHPNNPNVREARIEVVDKNHPATAHLNDEWVRSDEWYNFKEINPDITVLLQLDEASYEGGTNGAFHPIAWYHEFEGGRSFYTGGGHTATSFEEEDFQKHLLGGILYCLMRVN